MGILKGCQNVVFSFDGARNILKGVYGILKSDHRSLTSDESGDNFIIADEYSDSESTDSDMI